MWIDTIWMHDSLLIRCIDRYIFQYYYYKKKKYKHFVINNKIIKIDMVNNKVTFIMNILKK